MASWLAGGALLLLAALALPGTQTPTRAQEAPKVGKQPSVILSLEELDFWTAYIRGDVSAAADVLAKFHIHSREFRVRVALLQKLAEETGSSAELVKLLEAETAKFVAQRDSAFEAAQFRFALSQQLRRAGQQLPADENSAKLDWITNWWICGPFANERGQGFEEPLEPEKEFSLKTTYEGKDALPLSFRRVPVSLTDGVLDVGAMLRPNKEAAAFLVTAIRVENLDPNSLLSIASSSPFKLWNYKAFWRDDVDPQGNLGSLMLERDVERDFGFDQDVLGMKSIGMEDGWNVLVLKVACSEGPWRFRARITNRTDARVVRNVLKVEQIDDFEKLNAIATEKKRRTIPPQNRDLAPLSSQWKLALGLGELFAPESDRNQSEALKWLRKVGEDFEEKLAENKLTPEDCQEEGAIFEFLLAEASKSSSRVASGKEENKRRELLEQVLKLDPKAARAALELAKYYSGTFRNPTEADRYAKLAVSLAPKWVEARVFAARVATMKGLDGEVERELAALLKDHPNHPSVLRFAGYYRGLRGDYAGSDELFKRCLEKGDFTDEYCRERLFTRAVERNDTESALKYASETRQLNPFDLATSEGLIQLYLATGSLEQAMAECERALNICPREDKFLARKGEIFLRMADKAGDEKFGETSAMHRASAIAAFRESLKCNPNNEELARYLEFLADEKPVWEVKLQENIEARIASALGKPVDGNDPYRVVYRDEITVVNDDGTKSIYFQYAYQVCNDDGREVLQELGAPAYSDQVGRCVGARVYRRDGSTEEGRRVESQAMLPPLDVGDIVAVRYRVSDTAQSFFGDFFGAIETLGDNVPVDEVRLVYVLPKSRKFFEYSVNGAPQAERREEGDKAVWTYTAKNLVRVPREHNQLPLVQMVPTVQVSTYETWKEFGRWYYNLIKKQLEPTPEMRAKVASLIEGKTGERDKARAIYNWVVTNIRYNADWHFGVHGYKPFSAGAIFERCIGDCKDKAIVICTMLGIAGVKSYPVLIRLADSSEPRGREDITLPMPHHFNHAIAYIEYADGKGQFVDGTATFNGFDELPGGDAGAHVIIVRPEGGEQTQIPAPAPAQNAAIEEASLEFMGNGRVKLSVKLTATGDRASFLRAIYLQSGTRATQIENQWARHKPGAKVLKVEANDLANIDLAPEVKYEIEIPDAYSTDAQGNIEIATALNPLLFSRGMAAATARRTDIAMNEPYQWHSIVRIKLPEGRTLEKTASFIEDGLGISLSVSVEVIDREIVITRTYASGGGVIAAADYARLRAMMLAHDRAEAAKLKLAKE